MKAATAYTFSWTERKFEGLNEGVAFPYRYDRRHDLSVVLTHQLRPNIDLGASWVYGTGNAITLATVRFSDPRENNFQFANELLSYGGRNSYRMAPYHRFDVSLNWNKARAWFSRKGNSTFSLSVYNAYNRKNPFFIYTSSERINRSQPETRNVYKQVSLFPILPSISYRFHF